MHLPSLALRVFVLAAISAAGSACEQNGDCGDGKFCGPDGECHNLSCAEWYQYQYGGPASQDPNLDESNTETLTCKDIDTTATGTGTEVFYASVMYRCFNYTHPPAIETGFNRKCTAGGPTFEYTCYELSEGTQFLTFMSEVESAIQNDGMNCNDDKDPSFIYLITRTDRMENSSSDAFSRVFNETAELDKVRATTGTLYSIYKTKPPTAAPTPAPTPAPTTSSSHSPIAASKNWFTMFVAVSLQCSVMYSILF